MIRLISILIAMGLGAAMALLFAMAILANLQQLQDSGPGIDTPDGCYVSNEPC